MNVEQVENSQPESGGRAAIAMAPPRRSPHELPDVEYGWLSRLRSYLFLDPLLWLYTLAVVAARDDLAIHVAFAA